MPQNLSNQLFERRGHLGGTAGGTRSSLPQPTLGAELQDSGCYRQTLRQTDAWTLGLAMGFSRGQSGLLMPPLLLLTCLRLGMGLGE